jgi:hypothetical protein
MNLKNQRKNIEKQLEVLQPQIHIFCGTFYLYRNDLGLTEEYKLSESSSFQKCDMYLKDGKLFLGVYHPANRSMNKIKYIDQIIEAAKIWSQHC